MPAAAPIEYDLFSSDTVILTPVKAANAISPTFTPTSAPMPVLEDSTLTLTFETFAFLTVPPL